MRISDWSSDVCSSDLMKIKPKLGFDDSLDVFGIHGIGGLIGSVLTAVTMLPALGGPAGDDYVLGSQLWIQIKSVGVAVLWSAAGSAIAFTVAKAVKIGRAHV